jgi:uncharacterized cupredoxin-like copper-binding protein
MIPRIALIALAGAGFILAAACTTAAAPNEAASGDVQDVTVLVGDSMSFSPAALSVRAGTPVQITVRSTGNTDHDFVIPSLPATAVRNAGKADHAHGGPGAIVGHPRTMGQVTISFTPTKPGTYEYVCTLPGHREMGMVGTLTVT